MHYKTMVLELLEQRPQMRDQLRGKRMLLGAMETYTNDLKLRHEAWKNRLSQTKPGSAPSQIASEALEIALQELENFLDSAAPSEENEPFSLDGAMAFIRRHTRPV